MAKGKGKSSQRIAMQSTTANKKKASKGKVTVDMTKNNGDPNKLDLPAVSKTKRISTAKAVKQASTNKKICLDASMIHSPTSKDWDMAETNNVAAALNDEDTIMDMAVGDADNEFLSDGEIPPQPEQQIEPMETEPNVRKISST